MYLKYVLLLLTLTCILASCTSLIPRDSLPFFLTNEEFAKEVKVVTVQLPVIATSPNEGLTYGGLSALLFHDKNDEVRTLLAPQINQNQNTGTTGTLYGAVYPSADRSWEFNLSKSAIIDEDYELKLRDNTFMEKKLELNVFLFAFTDGTARFFGFQSKSSPSNETNYANREIGFNLSAAYEIYDDIQLLLGDRLRKVSIGPGAITSLPFIRDLFNASTVLGLDGFTAHSQKLALVYSHLDSRDMPTSGVYGLTSFELSDTGFGSTSSYRHYEIELKAYLPFPNPRFVSATRLAYKQTFGHAIPFLEKSILGGENTLRGFGNNRFIDNSYLLFNFEERIRLFRWAVFDVNTDWEITPFIDIGAVGQSLTTIKRKNFEFNPGIGFRALVRPKIVGRVDIGIGREGAAVFVGLGYPF